MSACRTAFLAVTERKPGLGTFILFKTWPSPGEEKTERSCERLVWENAVYRESASMLGEEGNMRVAMGGKCV